jgi:septal ring factor EnvC (AmiA/AmiB activator)
MRRAAFAFLLTIAAAAVAPAVCAQDIGGVEVCTVEKDMARRTSCLQANVELLHQLLTKETRRAQAAEATTAKEVAALRADVAALKAALDKTQGELAELKKPKPAEKK